MQTSIAKLTLAFAVAMLALSATAGDAEAKRRWGGSWGWGAKTSSNHADDANSTRLPVVIPSVSLAGSTPAGPEVEKVLDLPDVAEFQRDDGRFIDLGWRFIDSTDGEWVGYIGSDTNYMTIAPDQLSTILQIAGIAALPDPPRRAQTAAASSASDLPWATLIPLAIGLYVISFVVRRIRGRRSSDPATDDTAPLLDAYGAEPQAQARVTSASTRNATAAAARGSRAATIVPGSPSVFGRRA